MIDSTLNINITQVVDFGKCGLIKEYAHFLYLKSLYKNSCVYNYTHLGLSKKSRLSRAAVKKHVSLFLELGWCRIHSGNLIFNKRDSFDENKQRVKEKFKIRSTVKEILYDLYLVILKNKQKQFDSLKKLRHDIDCSQNPYLKTRAEKLLRKYGLNVQKLPSANAQLKISTENISKLFKCSVGKCAAIIKKLKVEGLIEVISERASHYKTYSKKMMKGIVAEMPNSYISGNFVVKVECNKYRF